MDFRCIPGERFRDLVSSKQAEIETTQQLSTTELAALHELLAWDGESQIDFPCKSIVLQEGFLDHGLASEQTLLIRNRVYGSRQCRGNPVRNHMLFAMRSMSFPLHL